MLLDKEIPLSPAEWEMWKKHPITQVVFDVLSDERSMWVEDLVFGRTLETAGSEIKETAIAVGVAKGIGFLLEGIDLYLSAQWEEVARRKSEMEEESND